MKGTAPERFLHPYFDAIADAPAWRVIFIPPFEAVSFAVQPDDRLAPDDRARLRFHLEHVLTDEFYFRLENHWANLPQLLRNWREGTAAISGDDALDEARKKLRDVSIVDGINSWFAGFWRGFIADEAARRYVAAAASRLAESPLPLS